MLIGGDVMPQTIINIDTETEIYQELCRHASSEQQEMLLDLYDAFCVKIDSVAAEMYQKGLERGRAECKITRQSLTV